MGIFSYFYMKMYGVCTLQAPDLGIANVYPQHIFLSRKNKKYLCEHYYLELCTSAQENP